MKIEKKNLPKSVVEFTIVVDETEFETYHKRGFEAVQAMVEVDGFRKGNAPEELIVKKYGDMIIREEMANIALRDAYIKAIEEHKISPITEPTVSITKLAKGNPLELTISVSVMPEITVPDYKKVAKGVKVDDKDVDVTEKDIDAVIDELRKGRATQHDHEHHDHDGHDHSGHDHAHEEKVTDGEVKPEVVLPELTDEFAQSFGPEFKTVTELKSKVSENLKLEKTQKAKEKRRLAIMEAMLDEAKDGIATIPEVLIEGELNNMLAQMRADITRFGGTWEEYLAHSKKTEAEIKADWKDDAAKRAMSQLLLHKIAEAEKLTATDEEIEVELIRLMAQIQDADENRAKAYLYQALTNEKVLKFLEESK